MRMFCQTEGGSRAEASSAQIMINRFERKNLVTLDWIVTQRVSIAFDQPIVRQILSFERLETKSALVFM